MIPSQLQRDDLLFVTIPAGQKGPVATGWNLVENGLRWEDKILAAHINNGGNIGCYPAPGSQILFIDIDDASVFSGAGGDDIVADTFQYSPHKDGQKYRAVIECPDIPGIWRGRKITAHPLEIFLPAGQRDGVMKTSGQVVVPPSIHPNGSGYKVTHDTAIQQIAWSHLAEVIDRIDPAAGRIDTTKFEGLINPRKADRQQSDKRLLRDRYGLQIEMPLNPRPSGAWILGASPFHDSTTGKNCAVASTLEVLYCFRHGIAYDAAGCEAIRRGLIECGDPFDGEVFTKLAKELDHDFPEVRYMESVEYRRRKQTGREGQQ